MDQELRGSLNLKLVNIRNSRNRESQIIENQFALSELHA